MANPVALVVCGVFLKRWVRGKELKLWPLWFYSHGRHVYVWFEGGFETQKKIFCELSILDQVGRL